MLKVYKIYNRDRKRFFKIPELAVCCGYFFNYTCKKIPVFSFYSRHTKGNFFENSSLFVAKMAHCQYKLFGQLQMEKLNDKVFQD